MKFTATAASGMIRLLSDEVHAAGGNRIQTAESSVTFEGDLEVAYRLCLWGRVANRVLLPLTSVDAGSDDRLYKAIHAIHWERHLHSSGTLAVDCSLGHQPAISHSKYAALKVKDAVVDRFRDRFGERPSVDTEAPDLRLHLHLRGDRGRISIDLSGASLHRRGYRSAGAAAPLKETLAAAILLLAGWPEIARRGGPLLDPMCGSGTLLIEAAMIAADIAPGLNRGHFGFLRWRRHDPELWQRLLTEARQRREAGLQALPDIRGYDLHPQAIAAATQNLAHAGLSQYIHLEQRALGRLMLSSTTPGLLVTNPPYGERLGDREQLKTLYAELGQRLQNDLPGWSAALLTGNPELAGYIGLPPSGKPLTLFNGPIECQLLQYRIAGSGTEDAAVTAASNDSEGARMFANRLRKTYRHLGKWARREGIDCFRLYDADLPEYAVAIDLYRGEKLWVHVQEYQAPKSVDADKAMLRLQEVMAVIPQVLEIPATQIHLKVRQRQKGRRQYERHAVEGRFHEVREGPCRLLVNFTDYLDTGLFLDHRITRDMLGRLAGGQDFLNLFAYTGAATVHAAHGGARSTTTVDLSNTYLDWCQRNMALNGLTGPEHHYEQDDVLVWLARAGKRPQRYGLIFIDPPTFSNSKRTAQDFEVQRDHVQLLRGAAGILTDDGLIIFSNNFRKFRLQERELKGLTVKDISAQTIDEDFRRNPKIHRCWEIRRS